MQGFIMIEEMSRPLEIAFKGDRNYLHGTDLLAASEALLRQHAGEGFISHFVARSFATRTPYLEVGQTQDERSSFASGKFRVECRDEIAFTLHEGTEPVTGRYPFDEAGLLSDACIDVERGTGTMAARTGFSPIEQVIALNKKLQYAVAPDVKGKWVFVRLDLKQPLSPDASEYSMRLKRIISGRFSTSLIQLDGTDVGSIQFMVGTP